MLENLLSVFEGLFLYFLIEANVSGIAEGGDYLHNSPSEAQKFNVVQLLISGTSAPTFGNTLLAAGVFKQQNYVRRKNPRKRLRYAYRNSSP